jgi:hypothetical protein
VQSRLSAAMIFLAASGLACDALKDKPTTKAKAEECDPCPKCPEGAGSAKTAPAKAPGLCDALGSFVDATEGTRSLFGDVELSRPGVALADADRIVESVVKIGGAESAEGAVVLSAILVRGRQELYTTSVSSTPKTPSRRKDLERYLTAGRLPEASTSPEIALGKKLAEYLHAEKGDEITVAAMPNAATVGLAPSVRQAKVVGLLDFPGEPVIDNEAGLALMDADDIRTIGLAQPGFWSSVRIWYKPGERAAGVLKLQEALAGIPMVNYLTLDQSLAGLNSLRPTLEAICASK